MLCANMPDIKANRDMRVRDNEGTLYFLSFLSNPTQIFLNALYVFLLTYGKISVDSDKE